MRRTIICDAPYDLFGTLGLLRHGRAPTTIIQESEAWTASRTPAGTASLHLALQDSGIEAEAWGEGAEWLLESLPDWLGLGDDLESFDPPPGPIRDLHRRRRGLRFPRTEAVYEAMVPTIIAQKVAGKEAGLSLRRLVAAHGEPAPGRVPVKLLPAPERLASMDYADFHPLGIERRRAQTLRRVAARAPRLEEATPMEPDEAKARLRAFPGVGEWTVAKTAQVAFGDADAVAVGDYNVPNLVAWNLAGEPRANDQRMLELLEPYAGHRARAVRLLELGGHRAPKFGPRRALRRFQSM